MILLLVAAALIVSGTVMLRYAKPLAPIFRQWFGQDYEWWLISYFYRPLRDREREWWIRCNYWQGATLLLMGTVALLAGIASFFR